MATTKTIGTSGADFTDINSWVSWVQANRVAAGNLTDDVEGRVLAVGFSCTTAQTISGWAPAGFTTTLTANPGDSFRDNANKLTNALIYNTSNGAFISCTSSGVVDVQVDKIRVNALQIRSTGGYIPALKFSTGTLTDVIVEFNILQSVNGTLGALTLSPGLDGAFVRNNLLMNDRGFCAVGTNGAGTTTATKFYFNDLWTPGSGNGISSGTDDKIDAKCNLIVNSGNCAINCRDAQTIGSNNATLNAAWNNTSYGSFTITGLTASQFSLTSNTECIDADNAPTDFRLATTYTKTKQNATAVSGCSTDIVGTIRSAGFEDIGCWQKSAGSVASVWFGDLQAGTSQPISKKIIVVGT